MDCKTLPNTLSVPISYHTIAACQLFSARCTFRVVLVCILIGMHDDKSLTRRTHTQTGAYAYTQPRVTQCKTACVRLQTSTNSAALAQCVGMHPPRRRRGICLGAARRPSPCISSGSLRPPPQLAAARSHNGSDLLETPLAASILSVPAPGHCSATLAYSRKLEAPAGSRSRCGRRARAPPQLRLRWGSSSATWPPPLPPPAPGGTPAEVRNTGRVAMQTHKSDKTYWKPADLKQAMCSVSMGTTC